MLNGIALIGSPFPPFIDPLGRHGAFDKSLLATSDLLTLLETQSSPFGGYSVTVTVPPLTALGDYGVTVTFEYTEMDTFIFRSFERSATVRVLAPPTFEGVAFTALDGQHGALEAKLDALEVGAGLTVADINDALSTALGSVDHRYRGA